MARELEESHTAQLQFCPHGLVHISKINLTQVAIDTRYTAQLQFCPHRLIGLVHISKINLTQVNLTQVPIDR